uniref:Diphthine--ammonia ligase n=3 Tax=Arion vulgaris TaxID=1028688 RepID=A0A0B7AT19_9EUPU
MKTAALISGGKDSCFNMMCCIAEGHDIVALANLHPLFKDELDSFMYQTVGHTAIDYFAEAMGLPLFKRVIKGSSLSIGPSYEPLQDDEVEDMFQLLQQIKNDTEIEAVSVGAILSDYQRVRVENVCDRLGLRVLSYLWRRDQEELLKEMIACDIHAKIIKVAAMGLTPRKHLMLDLEEILPHMLHMHAQYGLNICGEGGEYESFVYDCPLFKKRIIFKRTETVIHSDDAFAPVGYINLKDCDLENKEWDDSISLQEKILRLPIMTSAKWIEKNTSLYHAELEELGGGDTESMGLVMCVPDMKITGEEEVRVRIVDDDFHVAGIIAPMSEGKGVKEASHLALSTLMDCLNDQGLKPSDICSVSLYVGDMANFAVINQVYKTFFNTNPPVRLCIQANLPRNIVMQLDCQGVISEGEKENNRRTMHVQALSHWAPANIGPYSQAVMAGDKLFLAGMVPLVPSTLNLVEGGITTQCAVSLKHIQTVMTAIQKTCTLRFCPLVMCYLTSQDYIPTAMQEWNRALQSSTQESEKPSFSPLVQYCIVPALPKGSQVEWHTCAWPCLEDIANVEELRLVREHSNYNIKSGVIYCKAKPELFSCNIVVDLIDADIIRHIQPVAVFADLLQEYCDICEECGVTEVAPLVKILFSPVLFDYSQIHRVLSEALLKVNKPQNVHAPVVSLVSVNGLQTRHQILAWCQ